MIQVGDERKMTDVSLKVIKCNAFSKEEFYEKYAPNGLHVSEHSCEETGIPQCWISCRCQN
jgi:hypothetical protein